MFVRAAERVSRSYSMRACKPSTPERIKKIF